MLVNHLAWRNKFLMNNVLTVRKDYQHALDVRPDLPHFLWAWRTGFPLTGLFGFWVITVGFTSCYDPREEVIVVSDFTQQFVANKRTPPLTLIRVQTRHKPYGDTPHAQVLHHKSLACSI
jgi:hypothetical protein